MDKNEQTIKKAEDSKWEQIEDANFFKFAEIGDKLEGKVIEMEYSKKYDFGLYTVKTEDGNKIRFHGTTNLDGLMSEIELEDYIKVEYIGNEKTPAGDMKLFDLKRKKK